MEPYNGASQILMSQSLFTQSSQGNLYSQPQIVHARNKSRFSQPIHTHKSSAQQSQLTSFFNVRKRFQEENSEIKRNAAVLPAANSICSQSVSHNYQTQQQNNSQLISTHTQCRTVVDPDGKSVKLRTVNELPLEYQNVFSFTHFNLVQTAIIDSALYSDEPIVICAPTGSGKTVLFDMALIRLLMSAKQAGENIGNIKAIYMAPIKALCTERLQDWKQRFEVLGFKCQELTGDTDVEDFHDLSSSNIILTTPEKWDSMTRRWRDNKAFVKKVRLFMIDEVHMLNDTCRGATVEAVVSRMKTVRTVLHSGARASLRFVAVSATMTNIEDVAEWLGSGCKPAAHFKMDDRYRPVKLTRIVQGFPCGNNYSDFKFDYSLNYRLPGLIQNYSNNRPTLVFVSTRKGTVQAAMMLQKNLQLHISAESRQCLRIASTSLHDSSLRECIRSGIGFHNAGLEHSDRKTVEKLFINGDLMVLFSTSTLAMGVNLPAHLVIIKSTQHYTANGYVEYSETEMLQMIGRAGRPQFDTSATAVILTKSQHKHKYERLVGGIQTIESSLHKNLIEHLNAEIVLSTITETHVALEWLKSTFLYVRIYKNPVHYGLKANHSQMSIETYLKRICVEQMTSLCNTNLITMDNQKNIVTPTESGRLMARYIISFDSMSKMSQLTGKETLSDILAFVSGCKEFSEVQLRVTEKKTLNELNKSKNKATIRFPMKGKIKTAAMKINCLIQAQLGCLPLQEFSLQQDITKVFRIASRISKCLVELCMTSNQADCVVNALNFHKCISSQLWENSVYVTRQLTGIGLKATLTFVNNNVLSFTDLAHIHNREIEMMQNRHPPFGSSIHEAIEHLPKYEMAVDQNLSNVQSMNAEINVALRLANKEYLSKKCTAKNHSVVLIVHDADNQIVYKNRLFDSTLMKKEIWSINIYVKRAVKSDELSIQLLSYSWVGLDICSNFIPRYNGQSFLEWRRKQLTQSSVSKASSALAGGAHESTSGKAGSCGHKCLNKLTCAHSCCKPKTPTTQTTSTSNQGMTAYADESETTPVNHQSRCVQYPPLPNHEFYGNFSVGNLSSFTTGDEEEGSFVSQSHRKPMSVTNTEELVDLTNSPPLSLQGYTQYDWNQPTGIPSQSNNSKADYSNSLSAVQYPSKQVQPQHPYFSTLGGLNAAAVNGGPKPSSYRLNQEEGVPAFEEATKWPMENASFVKISAENQKMEDGFISRRQEEDGKMAEEDIPSPTSPAVKKNCLAEKNESDLDEWNSSFTISDNDVIGEDDSISYSPLTSQRNTALQGQTRLCSTDIKQQARNYEEKESIALSSTSQLRCTDNQSEQDTLLQSSNPSPTKHVQLHDEVSTEMMQTGEELGAGAEILQNKVKVSDEMLAQFYESEMKDQLEVSSTQMSLTQPSQRRQRNFTFKPVLRKPDCYSVPGVMYESSEPGVMNESSDCGFMSSRKMYNASQMADREKQVTSGTGFSGLESYKTLPSQKLTSSRTLEREKAMPIKRHLACDSSDHTSCEKSLSDEKPPPSKKQVTFDNSHEIIESPSQPLKDSTIKTINASLNESITPHSDSLLEILSTKQLMRSGLTDDTYSPPMSLSTTDPSMLSANDSLQQNFVPTGKKAIFNPSYLDCVTRDLQFSNEINRKSSNAGNQITGSAIPVDAIVQGPNTTLQNFEKRKPEDKVTATCLKSPNTYGKLGPMNYQKINRSQLHVAQTCSPSRFARLLPLKSCNPTALVKPLTRVESSVKSEARETSKQTQQTSGSLFSLLDTLMISLGK